MAEGDPRDRILAAFPDRLAATPLRVCEVCTTVLPVSGAAIVEMSDVNRQETVCATDDVADQLATLQFTLGEGPGIQAASTGSPVLAERTGLDFPDVFTRLRAHARRNRVRLSDVARGVIDGSTTLDTHPQHARKTDES